MTTKQSSSEPKTMADLLAKRGSLLKSFKVGEKVEGVVVENTPRALVLNIGGKSEGLVAGKALIEARDFVKNLKVGDKVLGSVLISETPDGYTVISLRNASRDFIWAKVDEAKAKDEGISVEVKGANQSGLVVEVFGLNGFIPSSQLGRGLAAKSTTLVGKSIKAKIIEVDKKAFRIILSEKLVSEADLIKAQDKAIKNLEIGKVYDGEVINVFDFGAFVKIDLGSEEKANVEGLVHVSEISWDKVDKPSDALEEGKKVKVKVIDVRGSKVSLSIKQAGEDPWERVANKFKAEDKVTGTVTKMSDFGAFVSLESGIEGLIHITKIPPTMKLTVGEIVNCYIEEVNAKEKRISLGLVLTSKPLGYK